MKLSIRKQCINSKKVDFMTIYWSTIFVKMNNTQNNYTYNHYPSLVDVKLILILIIIQFHIKTQIQ